MKRFIAPLFAVILLVGCAGKTDTAGIIADAQILIGTPAVSSVCPAGPCGLSGAWLTMRQLYPKMVTPAEDAQVQALLGSATAPGGLLDQLKGAAAAGDQAADLRGIESVVNQVLGIAAGVVTKIPNIDAGTVLAFQAAAIIVPLLEQQANLLSPLKTTGAVFIPSVFANQHLSVDQAKAVLRK